MLEDHNDNVQTDGMGKQVEEIKTENNIEMPLKAEIIAEIKAEIKSEAPLTAAPVTQSSAPVSQTQPSVPTAQVTSPSRSSISLTPLMREQLKYCSTLLKGLKRHPQSGPFQLPVDPIALGIPDYFNVIKHPMDLSTISKRLDASEYGQAEQFVADVRLMLANCFTFNQPETQVYSMGKALEKYFDNALSKMPSESNPVASQDTPRRGSVGATPQAPRPKRESLTPRRTSSSNSTPGGAGAGGGGRARGKANPEISFCNTVLRELFKKQHANYAWPFLEPVDPIKLGIPDYFDVIKQPMDLSTIRRKLDSHQYASADAFEADFRLMIRNCLTYNSPDSDVVGLARNLEAVFDQKWAGKEQALMAAAAAATHHAVDDGDSSDSERIIALSQQIHNLQQELNSLLMRKKGRSTSMAVPTAAAPRPSKPKTPRTPSLPQSTTASSSTVAAAPSAAASLASASAPMSFEEKRQLSVDVNNLSAERLARIVEIIQESMPNLKGNDGSDVIELDIESLNINTLRQLQAYVAQCKSADAAAQLKKRKAPSPPPAKATKTGADGQAAAGLSDSASSDSDSEDE